MKSIPDSELKDGFRQIDFNDFEEFIDFIRPDKNSVKNYFESVTIGFSENIIFRGHSNSDWELTPGIFREDFKQILSGFDGLAFKEFSYLRNFVKGCDHSGLPIPSDSIRFRELNFNEFNDCYTIHPYKWMNDTKLLEVAALAQHYGVDTSLLDWSKKPLISLYFAAAGAIKKEYKESDRLAIWVFNADLVHTLNGKVKVITVPSSFNKHIALQQGCFTFVYQESAKRGSRLSFNLEKCRFDQVLLLNNQLYQEKQDGLLLKITLPTKFSPDILDFCDSYGVNACSIFSDYSGPAAYVREIHEKFNFKFKVDGRDK